MPGLTGETGKEAKQKRIKPKEPSKEAKPKEPNKADLAGRLPYFYDFKINDMRSFNSEFPSKIMLKNGVFKI